MRARCRACRPQHLAPRHDHFHGSAGEFGQEQGQRFQIHRGLAAKAAPDLGRHDLDIPTVHLQHRAAQLAHGKRPLSADPDRCLAVLIILRHRIMRLDIALMDHGGCKLAFDHDLSRGKSGSEVAPRELDMVGDIGFFSITGIDAGGPQVRVEDHRVVPHGFTHVLDKGQRFVFYSDELERFLGNVGAGCRHSRDRMAVVQDFVASHNIRGQVTWVDKVLADLQHPRFNLGKVRPGNDRFDARQGLGLGGLD